jgi:pSer/pThr/pTyr-binding forkhead associated (FHA) protein
MKISIKLNNGERLTKSIQSNRISIGRSNRNDIIVPDEALSRQHCVIEKIDDEIFITDLGSANGVFISEQRIQPQTRTLVNTFLQLSLGPLECQVTDDEATRGAHRLNRPPVSTIKSSTPKIKIPPRKPIEQSLINNKKPSKSFKKYLYLALPLVILLLALIFANINDSENTNTGLKSDLQSNIPVNFRSVNDDFLTPEQYLDKELEKSCTEQEHCTAFEIKDPKHEGVYHSDAEYFVFFYPDRLLDDPRFASIKDHQESRDIIGLYLLMKSNIMKQFSDKNIGQIHLVIKDKGFKHIKVFRFHTKNYTGSESKRLLNELADVLSSGKTDKFWEYASSIVKSRSL